MIIVFQHGDHLGPGRLGVTLRDHGHKLDIRRPDREGLRAIPADLDGVRAVISMGGPQNVEPNQPDWLTAEIAFLKAAHDRALPVVGICLGSQMLAAALGGQVAKMPKPEVGFATVNLTVPGQTETMLAGIPWSHPQLHSHGYHIAQLPPGATLLASSALCKVQAFKAGIRSYGFQFHPECDKPQMDAMIAGDPQGLADAGLSMSDFAAQAEKHYPTYARVSDRLAVNLAAFLFPFEQLTA